MKNIVPELRGKHNLSQQQLAELLGVSRQTILAIEKGRYNPSLELAFKISKVFDLTIEVIFQYDENE
ncbi:helix-turn-helix transcriptional regulator [Acinetobacter baumannii]|uniref:helix-turn-helix transcriptional regulator n=1 Tax=Acinetobacter baumannii TaxID=470 RepID=UPI001F2EC17B|nr:helix-turn-helix transcriptional regulator [Acinetobacter baumannii]MCF1301192.1 helix-turn-helix transcriptional regulator [Acinetobacter baumannii]MDC4965070.1 helix-turn-helix transcriptional regulator [Acinetobacter baumannii]MDO7456603.1 helix-turn-helix transcriptional regulator [Acinetobacter baumannii]WNX64880.1 helix-turn-helix transcriptional regulator [Acinetobacter baumannii]HAV4522087.1 helix-turn-helix domain-containing protein [Acinetobacter baumannii]